MKLGWRLFWMGMAIWFGYGVGHELHSLGIGLVAGMVYINTIFTIAMFNKFDDGKWVRMG